MIQIERFINQLMTSNCYIIYDNTANKAIIVDPASEKMLKEIEFIKKNNLQLDYIILTHEHTDHTWGVNALIEAFNPQVVCSECCKENLSKESQAYFSFYFDNPNYEYKLARIDHTTEELGNRLKWNMAEIYFINTSGHSKGSVCFSIENRLFTGDAIMQYKPFISKKSGSSEQYNKSVETILSTFDKNTMVYPGHGEIFQLNDYITI